MGRHISPALQDHLDSGCTTITGLCLITPRTPGFAAYGVTELDRDVVYGGVTYSAAVGLVPSSIIAGSGLSVDNAEGTSLLPEFDIPVSEADIRAGAYDYAEFTMMIVNYEDLSMGHLTLHEGTIGQVSIDSSGLSFVNEFRGLAAQLKQSLCEKDSLTCRATLGSQAAGSATPGPIERFPCGIDAESLLVAATVDTVGLENTVTFTLTSFALDEDALAPGLLVWDTGLNAGRSYEIQSNTAGGEITLWEPTPFPIAEGDTLRYRRDCNKHARDADKGCVSHWGAEWVLHFRGEPDIPIGDAGSMQTPGASSSPGRGGTSNQPIETAEA